MLTDNILGINLLLKNYSVKSERREYRGIYNFGLNLR